MISFLAGFVGLGKIADKVMEIIKKIRAPIDKALDKVVDWIVNAGKKLFGSAKQAVKDWWKKPKPFTTKGGEKHELTYVGDEKTAVPWVASGNKMTLVDQPWHSKRRPEPAARPRSRSRRPRSSTPRRRWRRRIRTIRTSSPDAVPVRDLR